MSIQQFYIKETTPGGKVRYIPATEETVRQAFGLPVDDGIVTTVEFSDDECLTVAASLGIVLLKLIERTREKTKNGGSSFFERKIRDVRTAITELFRGTGCRLKLDIAEGVMRCWDETMQRIASEGIDDSLINRG